MFIALALLTLSLFQQAPDPTLPPSGVKPAMTARGRGVQIYTCAAQGSTFQWTLKAPEATLSDVYDGSPLGTHGAGPTWTWKDGSAVRGKVLQNLPSANPANIPSLLLETHPVGPGNGFLSTVVLVRRSDTQGGVAPATGCDQHHQDATTRVPYTATYTFYKKAQ